MKTYTDVQGCEPVGGGVIARDLPRISVVTPTFNQGRFIRGTLESVLNQDYPALEYIVVDGGSTDDTRAILEEYSAQLSYWVSEPDDGQADALAKGFEHASGDVLCWVNSDDLLEPGSLALVAERFAGDAGLRFMWGDARWIDEHGRQLYIRREIPFVRWLWLYGYNYIPQPAAFWRRDLYDQVGGIDRAFRVAMDTDLFARMSRDTRLEKDGHVLASFRVHAMQRTRLERAAMSADESRIIERETGMHPGRFEWTVLHLAAKSVRGIMRAGVVAGRWLCAQIADRRADSGLGR